MFQPKVPILVFDFETSGLDAIKCQPIEICVKSIYPSGDMELFHTLVRMEGDEPLHPKITELTGITDAMLLEQGIPYKDAARGMLDVLFADSVNPYLVGHNFIKFDIRFLEEMCRRMNYKMEWKHNGWDTAGHYKAKGCKINKFPEENLLRWHARALNTPVKGFFFKLLKCCEEAGIVMEGAHRADADVEMTLQLFLHQYGISIGNPELLAQYREHQFLQSEKLNKGNGETNEPVTGGSVGTADGKHDAEKVGPVNEAGGAGREGQPAHIIPVAEPAGGDDLQGQSESLPGVGPATGENG